jgi:hypothetical protein
VTPDACWCPEPLAGQIQIWNQTSESEEIGGFKNMPRKGAVPKRDVLPDPIYNSKIFTKLVNQVMWDGKKSLAERICYDAFAMIERKLGKARSQVFEEAMKNITSLLKFRARE